MMLAERDIENANAVQGRIWRIAIAPEHTSARLLLLPALNEMFDITTARTAVLYIHIPGLIMWLLGSVSLLSGLLAGYGMSKRTSRSWLHMIVYALSVAGTVYVVIDLDHPRAGLIRVDQSDNALTKLRQTL